MVGKTEEITKRYRAKQVIDASNRIIFPGLINTHGHLYQTFFRGLGDDMALFKWLKETLFPVSEYVKY